MNGQGRLSIFFKAVTIVVLAAFVAAGSVKAQSFSFQFQNPSFGGNPNNFHYLMQSAEAQKPDFSDDDEPASFRRNPLEDFQQNLQRQLLSQLSRQMAGGTIGDLDLTQAGMYDLGDFTIEIIDGLDMITVEISDQTTGERTQVEIPRF